MSDEWQVIPHYPDYVINQKGVVKNIRLNRLVMGVEGDGNRRVSLRSEDGYYHQHNVTRLLEMVNFGDPSGASAGFRMISIVETGETFNTASEVAEHLLTDVSAIYKVLRGERPKVRGYSLEYVYV